MSSFKFIYLFTSTLRVSDFLLAELQRQVYSIGEGLLSMVSASGLGWNCVVQFHPSPGADTGPLET
jgi:hypothetical protein